MTPMLYLQIHGTRAPIAEIDEACEILSEELTYVPDVTVTRPSSVIPRGAKSVDAAAIGQIIVAILGSGSAAVLVGILKDWFSRNAGLKLRIKRSNGSEIHIEGGDLLTTERLLEFLQRPE